MRRVLTKEMEQHRKDTNRLWLTAVLLALAFFYLFYRLAELQIVKASELQKKAIELRHKSIRLLALRGAIRDREGQVLVNSEWVAHVAVNPSRIGETEFTSKWLAKHLNQDSQSLLRMLNEAKQKGSRYLRIAKNVPWKQAEKLRQEYRMAVKESKSKRKSLSSELDFERRVGLVWLEKTMARKYPNDSLAAHVLGLVNIEQTKEGAFKVSPDGGLEQTQNEILSGTDGVVEGEVDGSGWIIPETRVRQVDPLDGQDISLTLDASLQAVVEKALQNLQKEHSPKASVAIVLEPKTGEILALACFPSYNPGDRGTLVNRSEALVNRAISHAYEPGSIFKPLTVAWALQQNFIRSQSSYYCSGSIQIGKRRIRCAQGHVHKGQSLEKVLSLSCNVAMAKIGMKMGGKQLYACAKQFGLLNRTGIELPHESSGWMEAPETWQAVQLRSANVAFGQGIIATPLGIASAYAALANDGVWVQPHLIKDRKDVMMRRVVSPEIARQVRLWLVDTIENGTGKSARIDGYTLAGKTGTAQKADRKRGYLAGKYVSSFIGFVTAHNTKAVVLVMADEPRNGYFASDVAAPAFREIAGYLVWRWRLERN